MQKVQRRYYRNLIKKLKANNQEVVDNITKKADVAEDETSVEKKKTKTKKVHENSRVKKDVEADKPKDKEDKKD